MFRNSEVYRALLVLAHNSLHTQQSNVSACYAMRRLRTSRIVAILMFVVVSDKRRNTLIGLREIGEVKMKITPKLN